jgi:hypothetical protein
MEKDSSSEHGPDKEGFENLKIKFDIFCQQNLNTVLAFIKKMPEHPVDKNAIEKWKVDMYDALEQRKQNNLDTEKTFKTQKFIFADAKCYF